MVDNTKFGVEIKVDADEAIKKLMALSSVMKQFADTTQKETNTVSSSFSNMGFSIKNALNALGITLAGLSFSNLLTGALKASAELESAAVSFQVFTGSAEVAKNLMDEFKQIALKSPMQFQDIVQGGKVLMNYGITTQQVIPLIKMLGDISGGNSDRFNRLALAFGQVNGAGRLMGQELRQMINAGFNPLQVISERTGQSMALLQKRMSDGQISVREVAQAFIYATSEGGRFFQNAELQSNTLQGAYNKMSEGIKFALADIGDNIAKTFDLGGAATQVTFLFGILAENFKTLNEEGGKSEFWSETLKQNLRDITLVLDLAIKGFMFLGQAIESLESPIDKFSKQLDDFVISIAGTFGKKVQDAVKSGIDYVNNFGKATQDVAKAKSPLQTLSKQYEDLKKKYDELLKSFSNKPTGLNEGGLTKSEKKRYQELLSLAKFGVSEVNGVEKQGLDKRLDDLQNAFNEELEKYRRFGIDVSNITKTQSNILTDVLIDEERKRQARLASEHFDMWQGLSKEYERQEVTFYEKRKKAIQDLSEEVKGIAGEIPETFQDVFNRLNKERKDSAINQFATSFIASVEDFRTNVLTSFGELAGGIMSGAMSLKSGFDFLMSTLLTAAGDFLIQTGTAAIKLGFAKSAIEAALVAAGPAAVPIGLAAIAAGTALKNMAKNMTGDTTQGINNATRGISNASGRMSGASFAYGGASYATQSIKLQIDLTGAITASPTGYNINKSLETVLRVTGRE